MIRAEVEMVGTSMNNNAPVVILKGKDENKGILPIGIGLMEAYAIHLGLDNKETPRPLTHELLSNILTNFEIEVVQVEVTALKNQTFYGAIKLKQSEETKVIDSRSSDAIALALRKDVPIFIEEEVAEESFVYGDAHEYVDQLNFEEHF